MLILHSSFTMVARKHSQWNIPLAPSQGGDMLIVILSIAKDLDNTHDDVLVIFRRYAPLNDNTWVKDTNK